MLFPGLLRRKTREPTFYFRCCKKRKPAFKERRLPMRKNRRKRKRKNRRGTSITFFLKTAAAKQRRQALTLASGVAFPITGDFPNHNKSSVFIATIINRIAAGFKAFPLFIVGKKMPFFIFDGKPKPQFPLVFLE